MAETWRRSMMLTGAAMGLSVLAACVPNAGGGGGDAAAVASIDPDRVMGLSPSDLRQRLGEPELTQTAADAQLWQYRSADCVFDLVLYPNANGSPEVTYTEARRRDGGAIAPATCLGQVATQGGRAGLFL